jgi:hypothetical protein
MKQVWLSWNVLARGCFSLRCEGDIQYLDFAGKEVRQVIGYLVIE